MESYPRVEDRRPALWGMSIHPEARVLPALRCPRSSPGSMSGQPVNRRDCRGGTGLSDNAQVRPLCGTEQRSLSWQLTLPCGKGSCSRCGRTFEHR